MFRDDEEDLLQEVRDILMDMDQRLQYIEKKLDPVDMRKVNKLLEFIDECETLEKESCCGKGCGTH